MAKLGVQVVHGARTGPRAARARRSWRKIVVGLCEQPTNVRASSTRTPTPLWDKMKKIATKIYGASDITADAKVRGADQEAAGGRLRPLPGVRGEDPVLVLDRRRSCAARRPDHVVNVREVRLAAGAEFVVMICGDIMTMPGLPKVPSATKIDIDETARSSACSRA